MRFLVSYLAQDRNWPRWQRPRSQVLDLDASQIEARPDHGPFHSLLSQSHDQVQVLGVTPLEQGLQRGQEQVQGLRILSATEASDTVASDSDLVYIDTGTGPELFVHATTNTLGSAGVSAGVVLPSGSGYWFRLSKTAKASWAETGDDIQHLLDLGYDVIDFESQPQHLTKTLEVTTSTRFLNCSGGFWRQAPLSARAHILRISPYLNRPGARGQRLFPNPEDDEFMPLLATASEHNRVLDVPPALYNRIETGDILAVGSDATRGTASLGELVKVDYKDGGLLLLHEPLTHTYATADNARVAKLDTIRFSVDGPLRLGYTTGGAYGDGGRIVYPSDGPKEYIGMEMAGVENADLVVETFGTQGQAVLVSPGCYNTRIRLQTHANTTPTGDDGAGVNVGGFTRNTIVTARGPGRHTVACGGSSWYGGLAHMVIYDGVDAVAGRTNASIDMHEETDTVIVRNCTATSGDFLDPDTGSTVTGSGITTGARRTIVENLYAYDISRAIEVRKGTVDLLVVKDLELNNADFGIAVNEGLDSHIKNLVVENVRGTLSGLTSYGVWLHNALIDRVVIGDIDVENGGGIYLTSTLTMPADSAVDMGRVTVRNPQNTPDTIVKSNALIGILVETPNVTSVTVGQYRGFKCDVDVYADTQLSLAFSTFETTGPWVSMRLTNSVDSFRIGTGFVRDPAFTGYAIRNEDTVSSASLGTTFTSDTTNLFLYDNLVTFATGLTLGAVTLQDLVVEDTGAVNTYLRSLDGKSQLLLDAAAGQDAQLFFQEAGTSEWFLGYDASANLLRLHSYSYNDYVARFYDTGSVQLNNTALGFFGAAPVAQSTAIADAAGGATVDAEARAAVNALLAYLRTRGDIAT